MPTKKLNEPHVPDPNHDFILPVDDSYIDPCNFDTDFDTLDEHNKLCAVIPLEGNVLKTMSELFLMTKFAVERLLTLVRVRMLFQNVS